MQSMMAIINLHEQENSLAEITLDRPIAALPFGGRYRLIDFILSNLVNSGITNVGVLVQNKYRSLMDHLRSGKEWDLARKKEGLFLLPPSQLEPAFLKGDLEHFFGHLDYLRHSRQDYVVLAGSAVLCNIDFRQALSYHEQKRADVTLVYTTVPLGQNDFNKCTTLRIDEVAEPGRVLEIQVNPVQVRSNKISMGMMIMARELLIELIDRAMSHGEHDLLQGVVIRNLDRLQVYGYAHEGYVGRIHSVASYYAHNLALLKPEIYDEIFYNKGLIYTKVKDEAPTEYRQSARVEEALIANGCIISGQVDHSILFRSVRVQPGAKVKDSIIMQQCQIGEDVVLENVICDKDVKISRGKRLIGERNYPLVIKKGTVI